MNSAASPRNETTRLSALATGLRLMTTAAPKINVISAKTQNKNDDIIDCRLGIETRSLPSLARRFPSRLCLLSRRSLASAADCGLPIEFFARVTRFGVRRPDAAFERPNASERLREPKQSADYFAFLIALTTSSKSGHSPDWSLEWSSLPLARISKAPPLEGISVSDLMRSPSSRILAAKLTAFGV